MTDTRVAVAEDPQAYGEVFTRRWVVDLILDMAGYTSDQDLATGVVVEPSCGAGAFLVPIVERLVASCREHDVDLTETEEPIQAFDLQERNVSLARKAVAGTLVGAGLMQDDADRLAMRWITKADFLSELTKVPVADWVIGNPPYIRLEDIEPSVLADYRRDWSTMRGRADIYVGFMERGLSILREDGRLGFIVADRWMRNQYGARLRQLLSGSYSIDAVIQMHDVDAFEVTVSAYPAVVVARRARQGRAVLVDTSSMFDRKSAQQLIRWSQGRGRSQKTGSFEATRWNHGLTARAHGQWAHRRIWRW